ncbi:MAG: hypothetical protein GX201_11245 [Clostridiales bacterium]|nr:hypothetical protein [Clostridiales bacterium]
MKRGKVVVLLLLFIAITASLVSFTTLRENETITYNMYVNNKSVGAVKYAAKGLALYDNTLKQLSELYPEDVWIGYTK